MANDLITGVSEGGGLISDSIRSLLAMPDAEGKMAVLEKMITLYREEQDRQAKADFDKHFAELRKALQPVQKAKENTFLKSKYATLDALQTACDETIFSHGFSYSWREEALDSGSGKRIWLDISGYGHTKSNYFDAPHLETIKNREGKDVTNPIQAAGIASSYGQRYTFKAGFGIVTIDEDMDGEYRTVKIDEALQAEMDSISNAADTESLVKIYQGIYNKYKTDHDKQKMIIGVYTERKAQLVKGE